ncbi:VPDSG-CTERM exosortase interaction domain protein [Limosilactobacillus reuteri]|uniref:EbsA family protein n=1 Tax=Limosilactobacillus reuteri TaxID=1598 RepID=UPI000B995695|nr:EbsA family protein [Limosilactobacillus reuteri]OYS45068.1 VPDSG-CTERM exosortase interaction domain protein [Limosilactobacillus reuteri]OYS46773.1 VPDSG-CTERM exosortase interaction domain protein [Limosilactobacillus reuteri]OYS53904.1 VPDSG-CTERM exosortase interaction domain protein [Limosilactobacillus reuteri]OYS55903.1 VPDSG-CTERM exosortase interaction domain protein [Limosilactobacillus reuteri]OYS58779.1 VPDSG-CTERM exosortase interaction domain protein [Limosilactobacillus reut
MTFIIMEEETRYFYQPDLTGTIISWCWTFLFFIAGLVIWLEITHFQWLSALFFAVFVILALLEWRRRTVVITPTKMVFNRLLQKQYLVIPISDIRQPEFTKHTVTITVNGEVMSFTFTTKAIVRLKLALKQQGVQ